MNDTKYYSLLALIVILIVVFTGCDEDTTSSNNNAGNIPAIGNAANSFSFAVIAADFSFSEKYQVTFNSSSVVLGLAVTNYKNGNGKLELINSKDSVYYSVSIKNNIVLGNENIPNGAPAKVNITFSNFTGQISIGLSGK